MGKADAPRQHVDSSAPSKDAFNVSPDNNNDLSERARSLFVGTGGDVEVDTLHGTTLTFKNVSDGQVLPIIVKRVRSTNTTASNIIALL